MHIDRAIFLSTCIRLVHCIDSINVSDLQFAHRVEDRGFCRLAADGSECAWNADAGVRNRSFGFTIQRTGTILAIYTLIGIVVGVTGSAVIAGALITAALITAILLSFTWNISLCISSVSAVALVTLVVVVGVGVAGHFD